MSWSFLQRLFGFTLGHTQVTLFLSKHFNFITKWLQLPLHSQNRKRVGYPLFTNMVLVYPALRTMLIAKASVLGFSVHLGCSDAFRKSARFVQIVLIHSSISTSNSSHTFRKQCGFVFSVEVFSQSYYKILHFSFLPVITLINAWRSIYIFKNYQQ